MHATNGNRDVAGDLGYLVRQAKKPYQYMFEPPPGTRRENCEYERKSCEIQDARHAALPLSLDACGFELHELPTGVADFYDPEELTGTYFREVEEHARRITGGSRAVVFDHKLRMREAGRPPLSFGRHGDGLNPAAVGRVHTDYTEVSGKRRLGLTLPSVAADRPFVILNFWRPVLHPALDTPLAVCDARTVDAEDLVAADIIYPKRTGEIYLVTYSAAHRWYYYPAMTPDEVLVFKHYDSRPDAAVRRTPHCAFDDPSAPADAPLRRSIEVRCLVLLD